MRILLVGNYKYSYQQSMQRFADLLLNGLKSEGCDVRLIRPAPFLGWIYPNDHGFGKWLGYVDRFLIFPFLLRFHARWADVIHICDQGNAMYAAHIGNTPCLVTCHDVMAIRVAAGEVGGVTTGFMGKLLQRWILASLRKAKHIVCVSAHTVDELKAVLNYSRDDLRVVANALNYPYSPLDLLSINAQASPPNKPYFLHVGGNQWYKNRLGVLHIFSELIKNPLFDQHSLIMAGKPWSAEIRTYVDEQGLEDRVHEFESPDNEQLRGLYSMSEALIFPSLSEGFGWPIVEAQACGAVVITTDAAPMNEVAGRQGAILIDPSDALGAASSIIDAYASGEVPDIRKRGNANAAEYTTDAMIKGYLDAYSRARFG